MRIHIPLLLTASLLSTPEAIVGTSDRKPNFVLILVDDK